MVLVDSSLHPKASWEFDADIAILTHSTTIAPKYQAVIHCEIVRQAARVVAMDRERLRSGDRKPRRNVPIIASASLSYSMETWGDLTYLLLMSRCLRALPLPATP